MSAENSNHLDLTPWFKYEKPVREGRYQVRLECNCCIRMYWFVGGKWRYSEQGHPCLMQSHVWRGLASDPSVSNRAQGAAA